MSSSPPRPAFETPLFSDPQTSPARSQETQQFPQTPRRQIRDPPSYPLSHQSKNKSLPSKGTHSPPPSTPHHSSSTLAAFRAKNPTLNRHFLQQYELVSQIGVGGFGFVCGARRREDGLLVAVKFIVKQRVRDWVDEDDEENGRRVPMEVYLLMQIDHPSIIKYIDSFEDPKYFYLITELFGSTCWGEESGGGLSKALVAVSKPSKDTENQQVPFSSSPAAPSWKAKSSSPASSPKQTPWSSPKPHAFDPTSPLMMTPKRQTKIQDPLNLMVTPQRKTSPIMATLNVNQLGTPSPIRSSLMSSTKQLSSTTVKVGGAGPQTVKPLTLSSFETPKKSVFFSPSHPSDNSSHQQNTNNKRFPSDPISSPSKHSPKANRFSPAQKRVTLEQHKDPRILRFNQFARTVSLPSIASLARTPSMDLFECIERNDRLDNDTARFVFSQIMSAVAYLHSLNISHRDLKDENIVIDDAFRVKLVDFGSAVIEAEDTLHSKFYGTLVFAPPEVLSGFRYRTKPADVWACGILLYIVLCGETPFSTSNQAVGMPFKQPRYECTPDALDLLRWMLAKDPKRRPTAQQVLEHAWLKG
ncbi:hypothetical protein HDU98_003219 [Podochytrium sp. JEL0797]|nr:hypothetical protein HDU98_003219 [Podochytrium sp. JEL0797]